MTKQNLEFISTNEQGWIYIDLRNKTANFCFLKKPFLSITLHTKNVNILYKLIKVCKKQNKIIIPKHGIYDYNEIGGKTWYSLEDFGY